MVWCVIEFDSQLHFARLLDIGYSLFGFTPQSLNATLLTLLQHLHLRGYLIFTKINPLKCKFTNNNDVCLKHNTHVHIAVTYVCREPWSTRQLSNWNLE